MLSGGQRQRIAIARGAVVFYFHQFVNNSLFFNL